MDIIASDLIYKGLKEFIESKGNPYGCSVVDEEPLDPIYPIIVIHEIRNSANSRYNTPFERIASIGFSVEIYAQTMGEISKKQIARELAKLADEYMSAINLLRSGFVPDGLVRDASLHRIIMTYTGNLHENTRRII